MKWASALSGETTLTDAVSECVSNVKEQLGEAGTDLAVIFASSHYQEQFEEIPGMIKDGWGQGNHWVFRRGYYREWVGG